MWVTVFFLSCILSISHCRDKRYVLNIGEVSTIDFSGLQKYTQHVTNQNKFVKSFVGKYDNEIAGKVLPKTITTLVAIFTDIFEDKSKDGRSSAIPKLQKTLPDTTDYESVSRTIARRRSKMIANKDEEERRYVNEWSNETYENLCVDSYPLYDDYGVKISPYSVFLGKNVTIYNCNATNITETEYSWQRLLYDDCFTKTFFVTFCYCSENRKGVYCSSWRTSACTNNILEPEKECDYTTDGLYQQGGMTLFGDFPCYFSERNGNNLTFLFNQNCSFTEDRSYPDIREIDFTDNTTEVIILNTGEVLTLEDVEKKFMYEYKNDSFSVSRKFEEGSGVGILLNPYDFNHLGNRKGRVIKEILNENDIWNQGLNFSFNLDFSNFSDDFFMGNRFYFEVGINWDGITEKYVSRIHVDFVDLELVPADLTDYAAIFGGTFGGLAGAILIIGIITFVAVRYYIRKKNLEKEDEEIAKLDDL